MKTTDQHCFQSINESSSRHGFTLVELLVVIVIIAILAAMSLTIQRAAVQSSRRERTVTTVRKIDAALTAAYEKYQYRKPDISEYVSRFETQVQNANPGLSEVEKARLVNYRLLSYIANPRIWGFWLEKDFLADDSQLDQSVDVQIAPYVLRTLLLRELLYSDFPDCLAEVSYEPKLSTSAVHMLYQSYYDALAAAADDPKGDGDISADLLYLIVMNTSPETRGTFLERETADTNGNGIPEFVDGWGNPIRFIRWAPSLRSSNRQPTLDEARRIQQYFFLKQDDDIGRELADGNSGDYEYDYYFSQSVGDYPLSDYDFFTNFETYYPGLLNFAADPFDPMQSLSGWMLTPLIYSAGPDREYGMMMASQMYDYNSLVGLDLGSEISPFLDGLGLGIGLGSPESDDNITNHNLE